MAKYNSDTGAKQGPADDLFTKLRALYKQDIIKTNQWRKEAKEDFQFRDGHQWSDQEKRILFDQNRMPITFNRVGVLVDAVVGSEIGNRREVRFIPREMGDAMPNELLSSAADWFRQNCDAEDEESEAFKDCVTSGMGWTETRLDYESNPEGEPKVDRVDPMEMVWDANSLTDNLTDAKRLWRVRKVPLSEAKDMFPGVDEGLLDAGWASGEDLTDDPYHIQRGNRYADDHEIDEGEYKLVTIVACQYEQKEPYYQAIIINPDTQQPMQVELDPDKFKTAQQQGGVIQSVKLNRKIVVQCWLGSNSIIKKPMPTHTGELPKQQQDPNNKKPSTGGFTWKCMTGLKDSDKGVYYGIIRRGKDPQRWANKWLSQMMHILNSQAKGGIMAEAGAFENIREAEKKWARPDGIIELTAGALTGSGPKIVPKPVAQFPAGFDRLLQYADEMIIKATGINMELLGLREVDQPGVLEYQRKQQGMAILAPFFGSLRRYRKLQGRTMLFLIQNFLADGRLIKIIGQEREQYVPLMKEQVCNKDYDVIVDDAPTSTNEKEKTFQILMQLVPIFKDMLGPEQGMILAEYSPLPPSLVSKLKDSVMQQQQQAAMNPPPMDPMTQGQIQVEQIKQQTVQIKAQSDQQVAQMNQQTQQLKAQADAQKMAHDQSMKQADQAMAFNQQQMDAQKMAQSQEQASAQQQNQQDSMAKVLEALATNQQQQHQALTALAGAVQSMAQPRKTTLFKNPDGSKHTVTEMMQ